jgi:hypothetical protein
MAVCGGCQQYAYCGSQCQTKHWSAHKLDCIGGGAGEKRAREVEQEELDPPGLQEINLGDLSRDIWLLISRFLSAKDLKNLNATQRNIQQKMRRMFFARFRFLVDPKDAHFDDIKNSITAVTVNSFAGLKAISFKRDNHITDVKVVRPFEVRPNAKLVWPSQITRLDLIDSYYVGPLVDLPPGLKELLVSNNYKSQLTQLPRTLEIIDLAFTSYDNSIDSFPMENLRELRLPFQFTYPIDILRNATNLKRLYLQGLFNQSIDSLPESIEELHLDSRFNRSVDGLAKCTNLRILSLGDEFNMPIDNLPNSLVELRLGREFWQDFPPLTNLVNLSFHSRNPIDYENLPRTIKVLNMTHNQTTGPIHDLPPKLEQLFLPWDFNQRGNIFPGTLKSVVAPHRTRDYLLNELPPGIQVRFF